MKRTILIIIFILMGYNDIYAEISGTNNGCSCLWIGKNLYNNIGFKIGMPNFVNLTVSFDPFKTKYIKLDVLARGGFYLP